jgi:hypothetical protein
MPKHRREDNIKRDIKEMGQECVNWIHVTQDMDKWQTLVNKVNIFGNFLASWVPVIFKEENCSLQCVTEWVSYLAS